MEGIFSRVIKAKDRTYFVDVKESRNSSRYLAISETRPGRDGKKFERVRVVVFGDQLRSFREAVEEAAGLIGTQERQGA